MMKKRNLEVIDLFCGIGGLSYGLKQAGLSIKAGLDFDASCKETYEENIKAPFINADIANYDFTQLEQYYSNDCIRVMVGCAPCQPFSSHTHKLKNKPFDTRWDLLQYFTKAVSVVKPEVVSMENVRGLVRTNVFNQFIEELESLGYTINYDIVFCPNYGIPQNRYRLVLIAGLKKEIQIPEKSCSVDSYKTVRGTIGNLKKLTSGAADSNDRLHQARDLTPVNLNRIRQSKPGGTWKDWDKSLLPECYKRESGSTFRSVYGRMKWDEPSPTITTQFINYGAGRFGHPEQDRPLTIREGALLQTFPKSFKFSDNLGVQVLARHIGNAVPPRLGEVIGEEILRNT